jgi:hypothetical protein
MNLNCQYHSSVSACAAGVGKLPRTTSRDSISAKHAVRATSNKQSVGHIISWESNLGLGLRLKKSHLCPSARSALRLWRSAMHQDGPTDGPAGGKCSQPLAGAAEELHWCPEVVQRCNTLNTPDAGTPHLHTMHAMKLPWCSSPGHATDPTAEAGQAPLDRVAWHCCRYQCCACPMNKCRRAQVDSCRHEGVYLAPYWCKLEVCRWRLLQRRTLLLLHDTAHRASPTCSGNSNDACFRQRHQAAQLQVVGLHVGFLYVAGEIARHAST